MAICDMCANDLHGEQTQYFTVAGETVRVCNIECATKLAEVWEGPQQHFPYHVALIGTLFMTLLTVGVHVANYLGWIHLSLMK